jgi:hypothetical protein
MRPSGETGRSGRALRDHGLVVDRTGIAVRSSRCSADASIKACFGADFCRPMVAQEGQEFARSGRSRKGDRALMGWMPPPDGIEVCQAGDVA